MLSRRFRLRSLLLHLGLAATLVSSPILGQSVCAIQLEPETVCNEGSIAEPLSVSFGSHTKSCKFDSNSDTDSFRFTASVGDIVQVKAYAVTTGIDLALEVRDPTGMVVLSDTCFSNCCGNCWILRNVEIETSGIHTVAISERDKNNSGDYLFQLERVFPASGHTPLRYGLAEEETLTPVSDSDVFAFNGAAGTVIRATASSHIEGQDMRMQIYSPSGVALADVDCFANCCGVCAASRDLMLSETGAYSLVVMENGANNGNEYDVSLTCLSGNCPVGVPEACVPSETSLCLLDGRFSARLRWSDGGPAGLRDAFVADPKTDSATAASGIFYFFGDDPNNWEILVKMLDGCETNHRFWVLVSASTGFQWELEIRDETTGITKTFSHPLDGNASGIADFEAFATCNQ